MNTIGIYKITSPTGKIYVGQSCNIERRFNTYNSKNKLNNNNTIVNNTNFKYL